MFEALVDRSALAAELTDRLGRPPTKEEFEENHQFMTGLADGSIHLAPAEAQATGEIGVMAFAIRDLILDTNWRIYQAGRPLVTCDEPVVILGGPGLPRTEMAGFKTAGALMFPLSPDALLVMFHPDHRLSAAAAHPHLDPTEVREVNRELVAFSAEQVFERPNGSIGQRIHVPKWPSVIDTEMVRAVLDGGEAEVIRSFKRTRWGNGSNVPPWPVERWWSPSL